MGSILHALSNDDRARSCLHRYNSRYSQIIIGGVVTYLAGYALSGTECFVLMLCCHVRNGLRLSVTPAFVSKRRFLQNVEI